MTNKTSLQWGRALAFVAAALLAPAPPAWAESDWPPARHLREPTAAHDTGPLPPSVTAEPLGKGQWRCTFTVRPGVDADRVNLAGSFNSWDRESHRMQGPDSDGQWSIVVSLPTGVHQYKFLIDNETWLIDPRNPTRVPDGYGSNNALVRLGRLAQMRESDARPKDGRIDVAALAHQCPEPLYIQRVGRNKLSVRYRTMTNDTPQVWLALKDQPLLEMAKVAIGPLFTYWAREIEVPAQTNGRTPGVRAVNYTFVLDDGIGQVADPYTYHYTVVDKAPFTTPEWTHHAVWYQVVLDRFRNGDPKNDPPRVRPWTSAWFEPSPWEGKDGQTFYQNFVFERFYGGDIAGLEAQLPYLKELGVNALYLTPIFKAPSYHKYDVQNYVHVDDGFGTRGDYEAAAAEEDLLDASTWQWTATDKRFLQFIEKAHALGFKVILDAVFNHVGLEHPAFQDVVQHGKRSRFADWFDVTSWEPFSYRGWAGFAHMPVFKKSAHGFASDSLREHLFDVTRRWMDPNGDGDPSDGIDGWRLDVPNDIPRPFWAQWRALVKEINPDAFITGEVWHRADQWLDGEHFDAVMNYEFAKTVVGWVFDEQRKLTASEAAANLAELRLAYPAAASLALQNLISSHDTDRLVSMAANPDREYDRSNRVQDNNPDYSNAKPSEEAYRRARLAVLLQVTYLGAPLIYYGDEVGMWGADDPSNRKPMLWRDLEPYAKPDENHVHEKQLAFYRAALALRNAQPALRVGSFELLLADDAADVLVFARRGEAATLLVALNASEADRVVHVPVKAGQPTAWKAVFGPEQRPTVAGGKVAISVPALGGAVLRGDDSDG